jgi:hypothetical protein
MRGPVGFAAPGLSSVRGFGSPGRISTIDGLPVETWVRAKGFYNPPPPSDGERLRLVVRDPEGWGVGTCETSTTHRYLVWALVGMDVSVWVSHPQVGTLIFVAGFAVQKAFWEAGPCYPQGHTVTFIATGPDAEAALEACETFILAWAEDRRGIYRRWYRDGGMA